MFDGSCNVVYPSTFKVQAVIHICRDVCHTLNIMELDRTLPVGLWMMRVMWWKQMKEKYVCAFRMNCPFKGTSQGTAVVLTILKGGKRT